jgi:hypothetical protein
MQRCAIDPSLKCIIRQGPNTGKPRPINDVMRDQVHALRQTVIQLVNSGFTVLSAKCGDGGLPTIQVAADTHTDEMIALDLAVYYRTDTLTGRLHRWGQFGDKPNGVRVVFCESPY